MVARGPQVRLHSLNQSRAVGVGSESEGYWSLSLARLESLAWFDALDVAPWLPGGASGVSLASLQSPWTLNFGPGVLLGGVQGAGPAV